MGEQISVDYLIVGAGPVGLVAARLLANQGRSCLVVERRDGPLRHPAAHVVNARTLEIFRHAELAAEPIDALASDPADAGHVNFVTRLNGQVIGRLPFERQGPECLDYTPTPLRNISQHRLEPILAQAVAAQPSAELRYRAEWLTADQDADGVTSTVSDLVTGDRFAVRSRYLLAADGAGSPVRKSLGISMVGPANLQSYMAIHFTADLRPLVASHPGVLHFVLDPAASGTFVAHDIDREWVFMTAFDPTEESAEDYGRSRCVDLVRAAAGDPALDITVVDVGSWHMSAQVADRMRDGRIFLVGDAAHRFPPTGGLGLNTGVADAHNLAWKLIAVDDGWADRSMLDTYQSERHPVAGVNCAQSTTNAFKMVQLAEALGLTTAPTTKRMLDTLADPTKSAAIAAAVAEQATHFDMIGLQLGHVYADGALARDGEPPPPIENPSRFEPHAGVGARLPHAWTDDGRSTLDLVASDGFTLIGFGAHEDWAAAVAGLAVPMVHLRIGQDCAVAEAWRTLCGIGPDGALLVRPDQHIAWRADSVVGAASGTVVGPAPALADAVKRVVGR